MQKLLDEKLAKEAKDRVAEAQPVSRKELEEEMAKMREEQEETRDLLLRAKAQGRAEIRQKEGDQRDRLKKIYEGTEIEQFI